MVAVIGTLVAISAMTIGPAKIGARQPTAEILQAEGV